MSLKLAFGGFIVGLLIGMTGMGGGSLMTPLLIFFFHMKTTVAVGTDLVYASITKIVGAIQHIRQKTVDFSVFLWMSIGSVPGSLIGSFALVGLEHTNHTAEADHVVNIVLSIVYLMIVGLGVWRWWRSRHKSDESTTGTVVLPKRRLILLGLVGGVLVGFTSIGSGSLFVAVLTVIYPVIGYKLVGTDILEGVLVTGVAGLTHLAFGRVDLHLALNLLIGSIPGILIGSRLASRMPLTALRVCIWIMLCWSSWNLLIKS